MVRTPEAYRGSSHRANALGAYDALVSIHSLYEAIGDTSITP